MSLRNYSLGELEKLSSHIPSVKALIGVPLIETYNDFISQLNSDLNDIVSMLEEYRQLHEEDTEDRLSIEILTNLRSRGYAADHDSQVGGHVDLIVRHMEYKWIAEAKKHGSYSHLSQGFNQLTTRYTVANDGNTHGAVIIYIFQKNAMSIMSKWRSHLEKLDIEELHTSDCPDNSLAFISTHKHQVSGLPYTTRHIPVLLHFSPQDNKKKPTKSEQPL